MIKAVLFDLGGVYFEDGTEKFLRLLCRKTGKTHKELYPIFREGKSLEYRKNLISGKEFFNYASEKLNSSVAPDELNSLWVSQYVEIRGIRNVIKKLKDKNIKVTVLSDNVPERVNYLQNKYHFLDLFDDVLISYQVNLVKESPLIFKLALARLNIKPEEAIFVDDRKVNLDIARKVGLNTILFTGLKTLSAELQKLINN